MCPHAHTHACARTHFIKLFDTDTCYPLSYTAQKPRNINVNILLVMQVLRLAIVKTCGMGGWAYTSNWVATTSPLVIVSFTTPRKPKRQLRKKVNPLLLPTRLACPLEGEHQMRTKGHFTSVLCMRSTPHHTTHTTISSAHHTTQLPITSHPTYVTNDGAP